MPHCDTITQHAACEVALEHKHGLPNRPALLAQLIQTGDHFMLPSYIPACWATLRRWQQAHSNASTLVTKREYEWVDHALTRITQQLRDEERYLLDGQHPMVVATDRSTLRSSVRSTSCTAPVRAWRRCTPRRSVKKTFTGACRNTPNNWHTTWLAGRPTRKTEWPSRWLWRRPWMTTVN